MISKLFLVGASPDGLEDAPKLEVDINALSSDTKLPEGIPGVDLDDLLQIKALAAAIEKYCEVGCTFYNLIWFNLSLLIVQESVRTDGSPETTELSVDTSLLLAGLLLSCSPFPHVECSCMPADNLVVDDHIIDSKTDAQVVEVCYRPDGGGSKDCTRGIYLIKRDKDLREIQLLGSYNIERERFEDFEDNPIEVGDETKKFVKRENWWKEDADAQRSVNADAGQGLQKN